MKKGIKITLIIVGVLVLLFCILIGIFVAKDLKMEDKLNIEVEEITNIMEATDFDEELFKKKLNNTVTNGDYFKVERAYKNYLRDYLKSLNDIIAFYDNEEFDNILTNENLKKDGKDYINSKLIIDKNKQQLEVIKNKFNSMKTEEKVLSYLDKDLDNYYVEYYKKIVGKVEQTETEKELSMYLDESSMILDNIYNLFEFLSANKNYYEVQDDGIYFSRDDLLDEYNNMILNLNKTKTNKSDI
ncbi:MAG: DUF3053 family protein [Bacilli bacterium]|nr:DUF3053 family protein [Bacilli bacterium]